MNVYVLVVFCVTVSSSTEQSFDEDTKNIAREVMKDCSNFEDVFFCFKKKVVNIMDTMNRLTFIPISENMKIVRKVDRSARNDRLNETSLDVILSRSTKGKSNALSEILIEQFTDFIQTATLEIDIPTLQANDDTNEGEPTGKGTFIYFTIFGLELSDTFTITRTWSSHCI